MPGQETKTLQATHHGQTEKKKEEEEGESWLPLLSLMYWHSEKSMALGARQKRVWV